MKLRVSSINLFPLKKTKENGPERNTCQKKLLKTVFKQTMWRVYRRTRIDEDYANYKGALNLATTEIRTSKITFQQQLSKNYSKSFYASVRSKQKVRDQVGPLENNSGNIISDGFQMAEAQNE